MRATLSRSPAPGLERPGHRRYDWAVAVPGTRRIWHYEAAALADALEAAGAWQAALRVRVAHREALMRRPEGSAFDLRPTPEDATPLGEALTALRSASRTPGRSQ
jgi:hypothetical protein